MEHMLSRFCVVVFKIKTFKMSKFTESDELVNRQQIHANRSDSKIDEEVKKNNMGSE
jgi:hypothetical protein